MNILVINGSPKGKASNTYRLTKAFLAGIEEEHPSASISELIVPQMQISGCKGCFACWNRTPGKCCIHDDMEQVIEKLLWADITIWSFPLYYFNVPGTLKNLIDRQLPMNLPFMTERTDGTGNGSHPSRYDMTGKRNVIISTCGFYTAAENYDSVLTMFDHMCGKDNYTTLFCGQGELFRVPELSAQTDDYLDAVTQAGREYIKGGIEEPTRSRLSELLLPKDVFEKLADASWGVDKESGEKEDESLVFTKQMAALYNKDSYKGEDILLDMYYTDLDKHYRIILGKDGSRVETDPSGECTTRIETPYDVWCSIAQGKISGSEALMKQMYQVKGSFQIMLDWDTYFGSPDNQASSGPENPVSSSQSAKKTDMTIMLIPWIVFWVAVAIDGYWGSLITIAACALVPLCYFRNKKTLFDVLSGALVTGFSLASFAGIPTHLTVPLGYLTFGIMWSVTAFLKIPLTAYYSMNEYNGEEALKNPLFIKTNRILTAAWGILYLLTPIWTYAIMKTDIGSYIGAINSILPIFMGIFTAWFQKWYPAKVARGK